MNVEAAEALYSPEYGEIWILDDYQFEYLDSYPKAYELSLAWDNDPYWELCGMPLETLITVKQMATESLTFDQYTKSVQSYISKEQREAEIAYYQSLKAALADSAFVEAYKLQKQAEQAQRKAEQQEIISRGSGVMQQLEPIIQWASTMAPLGNYSPGSVYGPKLTQKELEEVRVAVRQFVGENITADMTDLDKMIEINKYLSTHCQYAPDWSKNRANTAWGALIYHEAQCSGYARATKALCDAVGIPCYYIHADVGDHQWNKVMIEGNWYVADITNSITCLNMLFLVSDEAYTNFTGDTSFKSNTPIAEKSYGREW